MFRSVSHLDTQAGIGLEPRDARFCTLYAKIAHYFTMKCAIFASIILHLINR